MPGKKQNSSILLKDLLESKSAYYNRPFFIEKDPISVPHRFKKKQDIEIAGFFAAVFAWGNRTTIINKSLGLMNLMDDSPHEFCLQHRESELARMLSFRHRTFQTTDLLYFIHFLKQHYSKHKSLESAFLHGMDKEATTVEKGLSNFHHYFFSFEDSPLRTRKHIASPEKNSSCKRLNMFLRWMVRKDRQGVDFGIWNGIRPSQLVCPIDLHVARVAARLNLIGGGIVNWQTALQLTSCLRTFDPEDPVKYDFALFGMGAEEHF